MEKYLVSARKYRPSTFATVVGQKALTATLRNAVATDRLANSYLFCGSRGVGKTSCARIFAKAINCSNRTPEGEPCNECESCRAFNAGTSMNIVELDAASNNGVDDIRKLVEQVQVPPSMGRYRVFIVDEVHMLSAAAFNAFLKTLEEPPSYVVFILATTEKHKIIPTILSRCQIYDFHRITIRDMIDQLAYVAKQEGVAYETEALNVIARKADGAMRDALSIFDQVAASSGMNITYESAIENLNVLDNGYYNRLLDCFLSGDVLQSWLIYKEIRDKGFDSQFFINGLAAYFRDLMVASDSSTLQLVEASDAVRQSLAQRALKCTPQFLYRAMSLCNDADLNYRVSSNKQFLVELTLAKLCQPLSPSAENDSAGEGQSLQPITAAAPVQPAAPVANQASSAVSRSGSASAVPVQPLQSTSVPAPAAVHSVDAGMSGASARRTEPQRNISGIPRISIRCGPAAETSGTTSAAATAAQSRSERFSHEALNTAWTTYISTHPKAQILVNTMRASYPIEIRENNFTVEVQNQKQLEILDANKADILEKLHNALSNDFVNFNVRINANRDPRHTLRESELLEIMKRESPALTHLIQELNLRL
ncbi:MAG: DNA polymerase III subunit gamma/tau [Paramuribaculum sp.]|nr:DNA polymerase III subunit gamma/tau [Paramuribaculum sp.]